MKARASRILVLVGAAVIATAGIVMGAAAPAGAAFVISPDPSLLTRIWSSLDADSDGIKNGDDNCVRIANAEQEDLDGDGEGDACDIDIDNDGVENDADACDSDPDDAITDIEVGEDGCPIAPDEPGDVSDTDNDGINDLDESGAPLDNCPEDYNVNQRDGDGDGIGDACDVAAPPSSGGPGGGAGPGGPGAGAIKVDEEGCTLVGAAAFNPALFILLGAALLPLATLRRR